MSIWQIVFLSGAILSFGAIAAIVACLNRRGSAIERNESASDDVGLSEILATGIIIAATDLIFISKHSINAIYLFLLLLGQRVAAGVKKSFHRVENCFSELIEAVRGKSRNHRAMIQKRRGAVSFFLEQIKIDKKR